MKPYLLVGAGRAARHLSHYFNLLGIPFHSWSRKTDNQETLASLLPQSRKVVLLISDSQMESFTKTHLTNFQGPIIHISGALEIAGLRSAHPLMTFGPDLYEAKTYQQMAFALPTGLSMQEIFPELPNPTFQVRHEDRALYHAWAVYAGNLATLLWQESLPGFEKLGVPPQAVAAYLEQVLYNAILHPSTALTGPLARKDRLTVEKHLQALPEPARVIYQSFAQNYAPEVLL